MRKKKKNSVRPNSLALIDHAGAGVYVGRDAYLIQPFMYLRKN